MKTPQATIAVALLAACATVTPASAQNNADIDKLEKIVEQVRADLQALHNQTGIRARESEGHGEHGGRGEGRGEHGGRGEGEEGGTRVAKNSKWDKTRNGAHLVLAYNGETQSFQGTVTNTSNKTLDDVRVEVHLSNGVELGPTKRTNLKPGAKLSVELSAANQKFKWWTTHPEHGSEGHGPGHEGEAGEGSGNRPNDPALRPLYNQLLLLQREVEMLSRGLRNKNDRQKKI